MWNIINSNRLLDKKGKQQAQRKHLNALKSVKSSLNNTAPSNYDFLYTRPKARMMKLEKQGYIEQSNNILVQKMISLSAISHPQDVFMKDSLNFSYNKKKEREIDIENQKLVKRLRNVNSFYGQSSIVNSYSKIKSNLDRSRVNSTMMYDLEMPSKKPSQGNSRRNRLYSAKTRPYSANNRPYSAKN